MANCKLLTLLQLISLFTIAWFDNATEAIVGGNVARPRQHKYAVSVQLLDKHICGGCLIGIRHVLTAAHCTLGKRGEFDLQLRLSVVVGTHSLQKDGPQGERFAVMRAYVPQRFVTAQRASSNPGRETGDIAVLEIDGHLDFVHNRAVAKLDLPRPASLYPSYANVEATVVGYGCEGVNVIRDPATGRIVKETATHKLFRLKHAPVKVLPFDQCDKLVSYLSPDHICATMSQPSRMYYHGNCIGDNGNPLVLDIGEVIGVVSYSPQDCDESSTPAIYTRVTSFLKIIYGLLNNGEITREIRVIDFSH